MSVCPKTVARFAVFLLGFTLVSTVVAGQETPRKLSFLTERIEGTTTRYRISLTFKGDADGSTEIELPNEWGGQEGLYKAIKGLRSTTSDATLNASAKPHIFTVTHRPSSEITLQYFLEQDFSGPLKNGNRYRPVVETDYIHWIGGTVWVHPVMNETDAIDVTFDWKGFSSGWNFANSYGIRSRKQKVRFLAEELGRSITAAGDFRVTSVDVGKNRLNVAIRGKWNFADAELAEMVRKVIVSQREFWNDHSQKYFLVTLVPIDEGPNAFSFGGTGLLDSFALFATPNADVTRLRGLLAHEYFHNWNPVRIGKMPDPEQQLYWLSEGFTEFYTYELLARNGLISEDEYVDELNSRIREYFRLPTRTEPNERIVQDFWKDPNVGRLPYLRGMFFALNLNAVIKTATSGRRSLDDVMHELYRRSKDRKVVLSPEILSEVVAKYTDPETGSRTLTDIKVQMIDGSLMTPHERALEGVARLETVPLATWEAGFDVDKLLATRLIAGVKPGTAAYDAGLRDGQKLVGGVSIYFGDTEKEVELKVVDGTGEKAVRFLPVAREKLPVPQFISIKK